MTTAAAQFNTLVRLNDFLGPALMAFARKSLPELSPQASVSTRAAIWMLNNCRYRLDAAPLYALTPSAELRADSMLAEAKASDTFVMPTMPVDGCTIATAETAVFVCLRGRTVGVLSAFRAQHPQQGWCSRLSFAMAQLRGLEAGEVMAAFPTYMEISTIELRGSSQALIAHVDSDAHDAKRTSALFKTSDTPSTFYPVGRDCLDPADLDASQQNAGADLATAVSGLNFIDQPTHYVVEERPDRIPVPRGLAKKVARYDDRERWIILDPEEVKTKMAGRTDHKGGTHASPHLHLRRGHTKTLRDERYTFKRGQVINIRPTWVGDREWSHGRLKYKVVSRIGAEAHQA